MSHFVAIPPYENSPVKKKVLTKNSFFSHLKLSSSQKRFLYVKVQYLMSIYLWWIVPVLINQFTMKHFVTLPPYEISPVRNHILTNNSFFSHLKLSLSQKRFLYVKVQYLMSIYLWWIDCILKNKFTVKHFVILPPLYSMLSPLVWAHILPLVTAAHEISPSCSCKINPGVVRVIYTSVGANHVKWLKI